ncbi:hypothetical protein BZA05DRAFT_413815 [Tricharina praecox]|uniref:uncharacterized protein n=1 Tax=Tricharina praecox TaxID=43433 RepID=UPI0022208BA8|nr:uncharacterized protein BZA05DRAFT_413815 [Tricharina praecox]KAI5840893.1 hypothetical protein BZA05DRAFT_413815 [Tricharina praecox]
MRRNVCSISAYGSHSDKHDGSSYNYGVTASAQYITAGSGPPPPPMPQGYGLDPNAFFQGQPLLIYAISRGDSQAAESLIRNGASIDHLSIEHYNITVQYFYQTQNRYFMNMLAQNNPARHGRGSSRTSAPSLRPGTRSSSCAGRWPGRGSERGHRSDRGSGGARGSDRGGGRRRRSDTGNGRGRSSVRGGSGRGADAGKSGARGSVRGDGRGRGPFRGGSIGRNPVRGNGRREPQC